MEIDASVRSEVLDAIACGIILLDATGRVLVWNKWMVRHSGIPDDIAIGQPLIKVFPELAGSRLDQAVKMALSHRLAGMLSPSIHQPPLPLYRRPGDREQDNRLQQMINVTPIRMSGQIACSVQVHDVTVAIQRERKLREQAEALAAGNASLQARLDEIQALHEQIDQMNARDPLTGVLNRDHIDAALQAALSQAGTDGTPVALLMIDIDLLKHVNEEYGLVAGDALLRAVGALLRDGLPPQAAAGRYAADNFLVVLPGLAAEDAHALAENYRQQMAATDLRVDTRSFRMTLSIGVAMFPRDNQDAAGLIECLNLALFLAKHDGYNRVVAFNAGQSEVF